MTDSWAAPVADLLIKHLPPSASTLHLLDLGGGAGDLLLQRRVDLAVTTDLADDADRFDAVVACDTDLDDGRLRAALRALRPGGRFIALDSRGEPNAALVRRLEGLGYTRILVEEMLPEGVLMRGEKPHVTDDTHARILGVAERDAGASLSGRPLHLLIHQAPNKPVWALKPGEAVKWHAFGLAQPDESAPHLLAFSSLPKAVAFLQPAVVGGKIRDANKIAKFSRAATQDWQLWVNPPFEALGEHTVVLVLVDPALAETPDE